MLIYCTCYNVLDGVTLTLRKIEQEILAQGHSVCILSTISGNIKNTHMHLEGNQEYQRYRHLPNKHPNRTVIFLDNAMPIPFLQDPNNHDNSYQIGFSLSKDVKAKLNNFQPTIVHVTVPDVTCLHLIQYAREKQLPLMGTYHSNIPEYFTHYQGIGWLKHIFAGYERHQYNFLQRLFVPTPFIRRHLMTEDHYRLQNVTELKVWGRGVDLERFNPSHRSQDYRSRYGFAPNDVVVTWVGRLVPEKRPDIFAYVVRRLAREGIPFKALIVGAGPSENEMKSLPNTVFAGWASGDELAVAYASSDVFLFPSAVETFGNVTLEAAASGLPVVVDGGCSGHLVQHGVNGFACKDGDAEAYYKGTLSLVLDKSRREAMSKDGRKLSLKYEKRVVCRKMIDNYSTITEEFYGLYQGDHANRDRKYEQKPDSFLSGCYVRPTSLILVEFVFILIFRIMYRIAQCLNKIQRLFVSIGTRKVSTAKGEAVVASLSKELQSQPFSPSSVITAPTDDSSSNATENEEDLTSFSDMEEPSDDQDTSSIASSSCCSVSSTTEKNRLPISHVIAILFVKAVRAQGLIECRIRKWYCRTMLPSSSSFSEDIQCKQRKRKCSEELTPDDLYDSDMIALQLKESLLPNSCCNSVASTRSSENSLEEDKDAIVKPTTADKALDPRKATSSSNLLV